MSAPALEAFLARLYTDAVLRSAFLAAPENVAREAGLGEEAVRSLACIDRDGLVLAAESYAHKRAAHGGKDRAAGVLALVRRLLWR